jgi:hypothetical protein
MGLDLWFKEDVARILASNHETMRAMSDAVHASSSEAAYNYRQGFEDALRAVALAFGVAAPPPSVRVIDAEVSRQRANGNKLR